jgi:hypothetical protein
LDCPSRSFQSHFKGEFPNRLEDYLQDFAHANAFGIPVRVKRQETPASGPFRRTVPPGSLPVVALPGTVTTAVTGPPPRIYDCKISVIGGSR